MWKLFLILVFLSLGVVYGQEPTGTSTVTLRVGGGWIPGHPDGAKGGPAFSGNYEFRVAKYFSLDAGVQSAFGRAFSAGGSSILAGTNLVTYYNTAGSMISRRDFHSTSVPFGFRGILPVAGGRGELFAGAGGASIWNSGAISAIPSQAWGVYGKAGGRFALDREKHFWVGTTATEMHAFSTPHNWLTWTGDVGFRFGK